LGAGLLAMVTRYSLQKGSPAEVEAQLERILAESEKYRQRFLELVDLDAEAYLEVVRARKGSEEEKRAAQDKATAVPRELARLCYEAVDLTPFLVLKGNKYLISDVEVAVELLTAAFKSAMTMSKQG